MKTAKRTAAVLLTGILICGLIFLIRLHEPERYLKGCYHHNKEQLNRIAVIFKGFYEPGTAQAKFELKPCLLTLTDDKQKTQSSSNNNPTVYELETLLSALQEQYQKESRYPVFSVISAEFDSKGNMLLTLTVRATHIKGRSGTEGKDVLYCSLVYCDDGFVREEASAQPKTGKHLDDCWYMKVSEGYSG